MMRPDSDTLVVGISSRALFCLEDENRIYQELGVDEYEKYQKEHENDILEPGAGFRLVKALLRLNNLSDKRLTEIIIMSHNNADTSLRIFNSIEHYGLDITRAALTGGCAIAPYLDAFDTDLFLSCDEADVQMRINQGGAAGLILSPSGGKTDPMQEMEHIRIAFDGDAVLFSDASERIYKDKGLEAFEKNERDKKDEPLEAGPFAKLLSTLSNLQRCYREAPIRTALVTARNAPAHERVIKTLRRWGVHIDETFFLGGMSKEKVLEAFGADIFFDDQDVHLLPAGKVVPSAKVPYKQ